MGVPWPSFFVPKLFRKTFLKRKLPFRFNFYHLNHRTDEGR
nr:MAG TPA: hypothetical protein [Caudoviricetes sp.]